jgi:predicted NUDIX family NTP pyrophosphohydrolase
VARPRRRSAGIVLHRDGAGGPEVLLVHPGGPFWARKDLGAWSIPKGEYEPNEEDALACALREFEEETGTRLDAAELVELGAVVQKAGKEVSAWAVRGDLDPGTVRSNTFEMEWPPRSGRRQEFPEIDRAEWFTLDEARAKLVAAQVELIDRLVERMTNG